MKLVVLSIAGVLVVISGLLVFILLHPPKEWTGGVLPSQNNKEP